MTRTLLPRLVVAALLVCGCASRKARQVPLQQVELGTLKADYRDFSQSDACRAEPRQLASDLSGMNALLADFVERTSNGFTYSWTDDQLALLSSGEKALPSALSAHESTLNAVARCKFDPKLGIAEIAAKGQDISAQVRKRLSEAPALLQYAQARREVEKWKEAQPIQQAAAKQLRCGGKSKSVKPAVFYASEDAEGRTDWFFCDGARVSAGGGKRPEVIPAPVSGKKKVKKPDPRAYLSAASKYPSNEISHSPKLPKPELARDGAPPAAPEASSAGKQ